MLLQAWCLLYHKDGWLPGCVGLLLQAERSNFAGNIDLLSISAETALQTLQVNACMKHSVLLRANALDCLNMQALSILGRAFDVTP